MCFSFFPNSQAVTYRNVRIYRTGPDDSFAYFIRRLHENGGYSAVSRQLDQYLNTFTDDIYDYLRTTDHGLSVFGRKKTARLLDPEGDMICDGDPNKLKQYLTIKKTEGSPVWDELIDSWRENLSRTVDSIYDETNQLLDDMGVIVPRSENGMGPDFRLGPKEHVYHVGGRRYDNIRIKMSGNRDIDFQRAWEAAGIDPDTVAQTSSRSFTWHHLDDFNPNTGECTMQLVLTPIHQVLEHAGSVHMWELFWGLGGKSIRYS